jgi:hypothetical protein
VTGFALLHSEVPSEILPGLIAANPKRVYQREGKEELQFHWWQDPRQLPVLWDGEFRLLLWGNKNRRAPLPQGGWLTVDGVAALAGSHPEEVVIPAQMGCVNGRWTIIDVGVKGVVLPDIPGGPVVYVLIRPSTNYYRNLSGREAMMPVFVNQVV